MLSLYSAAVSALFQSSSSADSIRSRFQHPESIHKLASCLQFSATVIPSQPLHHSPSPQTLLPQRPNPTTSLPLSTMCQEIINDCRPHCPHIYNTLAIISCDDAPKEGYPCGNLMGIWCQVRQRCRMCSKCPIFTFWDNTPQPGSFQDPVPFDIKKTLKEMNGGVPLPDGVLMEERGEGGGCVCM